MTGSLVDTKALRESLIRHEADSFANTLVDAVEQRLSDPNHGDLHRWASALQSLPEISVSRVEKEADAITLHTDTTIPPQTGEALQNSLKGLMPWRKGPFRFFDTTIDTEWRSDWKWNRLKSAISPLKNRKVLDIGCGNGYHLWRMKAMGARLVLGVDPSLLFACQFAAFNSYAREPDIFLLPIKMEALPLQTDFFDTVFSMGVLYHRRSPIDYLKELYSQLRRGGELVLETLVIEGDETSVLVPEERYARMRNVWFIPSAKALSLWLQRTGFSDVRVVDESATSVNEQRSTDWMTYESLAESLAPGNSDFTVEGLPAPRRAVIVATRP